jgi:hypothetical protein
MAFDIEHDYSFQNALPVMAPAVICGYDLPSSRSVGQKLNSHGTHQEAWRNSRMIYNTGFWNLENLFAPEGFAQREPWLASKVGS